MQSQPRSISVIGAHQLVLTTRSAVFRAMFQAGMKEAKTKQIRISDDVEPEVFEAFLRFLYTGVFPTHIKSLASDLLPIASRYDIEDLKTRCAMEMQQLVDAETVANIIVLAHLHDCGQLKSVCLHWIMKNLQHFSVKEENWELLKSHPDLLVDIMVFVAA